jgi:hypothetical protein
MPEIIIEELHYIAPISNIPSILQHGILCHNEAMKLPHVDISMNAIQEKRANKKVPNGLNLHDYANLYFDARNPMLYKRREQREELCILRINPDILNLPEVVLSDRNASSAYAKFLPSPAGLNELDFDRIFAKYWTDTNLFTEWTNKSIKCAEALVPDRIQSNLIIGAYVCNVNTQSSLIEAGFALPININSQIFF